MKSKGIQTIIAFMFFGAIAMAQEKSVIRVDTTQSTSNSSTNAPDTIEKSGNEMISPDMVTILGLNAEQQDSIERWNLEQQQEIALIEAQVDGAGIIPNKMEAVRQDTERKVMKILTKPQRKAYKKMLSSRLKEQIDREDASDGPASRPTSIEKQPVGSVNR